MEAHRESSRRSRQSAAAPAAPSGAELTALLAEYSALQQMLNLAWSLSQQRTNVFFAVLSATAVSVGLVAQASGERSGVVPFTIVVLALAAFVGVATFVRVVEALLEAIVAILAMNRVRSFIRDAAGAQAAVFVLPTSDDEAALHRGLGGMYGHGPTGLSLRYAVFQVHGVIAILSGGLAGSAAAIAIDQFAPAPAAYGAGIATFLVIVLTLVRHLRRSVRHFRQSWQPLFSSTRGDGGPEAGARGPAVARTGDRAAPSGSPPAPPATLEGRRVRLRLVEPADRQALVEILAQPGVARWWSPRGAEEAVSYLYEPDEREVGYVIEVDGQVAGAISFFEENDQDYRSAGIDLFLGRRYQGRGLGPDAIRALARYLFEVRGHHRLTIDPALANEAAIRAYEKAGFRRAGVLRSYERGADGSWHDGLLMEMLAGELR